MFEYIRSEYFIDLWSSWTLGIASSKEFLVFVLVFPLIVALGYLSFYISIKFFSYDYKTFFYLKESVIFFSFIYFFFFVLILIDFIYYVEVHKLFFNLSEEEINILLNIKNK
jgi:hypothetical protein